MINAMIDLETLGKVPGCPIVSIGAVEFDPATGELGRQFYERVDLDGHVTGTADASTIKWWLKQSEEARNALTAPGGVYHTEELLSAFHQWLPTDVKVWGNGATFDISILEHAYRAAGWQDIPWAHWNVRDCRTVADLGKQISVTRDQCPRHGVHHNALDDAIYQAQWVSHIWQALVCR